MKYNIYCKKTHNLLAVYTNEKTLETLDCYRCYYISEENKVNLDDVVKVFDVKPLDKAIDSKRRLKSKKSASVNQSKQDDYTSPLNQVGYYAAISSMDSASSSSCDSSSSSDTSSSSSCDSGSW